jgi:dihydrofolate reductase
MRKIIVSEFVTLDGVMEAPGGEPSLGELTGWVFPHVHDDWLEYKRAEVSSADAVLTGRVTYESFAEAWPTKPKEDELTALMYTLPKYVVSTTLKEPLEWNNSHLIKGDVVEEVTRLKQQDGQAILVHGSGTLVQTLMQNSLVDEYRLMIFPVALGRGFHLFREGAAKLDLKLVDSQTFSNGVVVLSYEPAGS